MDLGIKQLVNLKRRSDSTPTKLVVRVVSDVEVTDPKLMADSFNNFLSNGKKLTKNIPKVNKSPLEYLSYIPIP